MEELNKKKRLINNNLRFDIYDTYCHCKYLIQQQLHYTKYIPLM